MSHFINHITRLAGIHSFNLNNRRPQDEKLGRARYQKYFRHDFQVQKMLQEIRSWHYF